MTRPDLRVVRPRTTAFASLIRTMSLLAEGVYPPEASPQVLNAESYEYGFNTGARSAYSDIVNRLRELQRHLDGQTPDEAS